MFRCLCLLLVVKWLKAIRFSLKTWKLGLLFPIKDMPRDENNPNGDPWTWTPELFDFLIRELNPKILIDIGCGEGHTTKYFIDHGVSSYGIDGSEEARNNAVIPQNRFILHDFTKGLLPFYMFYDIIWCCEFLEHIEEKYIENVLSAFKISNIVAITHAFPGQNGFHHVNCQLPEYWIEKMIKIGFVLDKKLTLASRVFASQPKHWGRSGMIFTKK